jgi:phosphoesterase RecJ-like protein
MTKRKMGMGKNNTPQEILGAIKSSKNILLIMDSRFDYDALGSVLALSDALKQLDIDNKCVYGFEIPSKPKEYFNTSRIEENVDLKTLDYAPFDLIIFLDSGTLSHLTKACDYEAPKDKPTLNIDHHFGNPLYGTLNYVQDRACTGSILYDLFTLWHINIDAEIADYLIACLISDTGVFQLRNVKPGELRTVADIIERGGRYSEFIEFLLYNETYDEMAVKGVLYSSLRVDTARHFAYSVFLKEDMGKKGIKERGTVSADTIKQLRSVDFVFTIETDIAYPEGWRISLRSHDMNYNVLNIAQAFGGGGHRVAAGCVIPFSEAKTIEKVVEKIWEIAQRTN